MQSLPPLARLGTLPEELEGLDVHAERRQAGARQPGSDVLQIAPQALGKHLLAADRFGGASHDLAVKVMVGQQFSAGQNTQTPGRLATFPDKF
jgi:Xaa-Pro aminopeptidase